MSRFDLTRDFFEPLAKDYFSRHSLEYKVDIFHRIYFDTDRVSLKIKEYYLEARTAYLDSHPNRNKFIDRFIEYLYTLELYVRSYERFPHNTFKQFRFVCSLLDLETLYDEESILFNSVISYSEKYLIGRLSVNRVTIKAPYEDKFLNVYTRGSVNYISADFIKSNFYKIFNSNDLYDLYHPIDRLHGGRDKLLNLVDKYTTSFYGNLLDCNLESTAIMLRDIFIGRRRLYDSLYNLDSIDINLDIDVEDLVSALIKSKPVLEVVK